MYLLHAQTFGTRLKEVRVYGWFDESLATCTHSRLRLEMGVEIELFSHGEVMGEVIAIVPQMRYQTCNTCRCTNIERRKMEMHIPVVSRKLVAKKGSC